MLFIGLFYLILSLLLFGFLFGARSIRGAIAIGLAPIALLLLLLLALH